MVEKKHIVFIAYNMAGGGLEKQVALVSNVFDKHHAKVDVLLWNDDIGYETSANIINLEKKFGSHSLLSKIKKYLFIRNYIISNKVDALIDIRHRSKPVLEFFLNKFIFKTKIFYTVHSSKIEDYGFKNKSFVSSIFSNNYIVCDSKCIEKKIKSIYPNIHNCNTIYNIIEPPSGETFKPFDFEYILFSGRINGPEKQVDLLIKSYFESKVYLQNVHLVLLGDDQKSTKLSHLIKEYNLTEFIHLIPFTPEINSYYKHALFTVLCSQFEGFGLVLVESLLNNTPVVSFDCYCGPSEIIEHNLNGLLIENQNFELLTKEITRLVSDRELLNKFKSYSLNSLAKFSSENIYKDWKQLLSDTL
jgi:N-acetylgalactosamine-N,N'-diacetylbacillosaminyl-diphospho-undecaprenol 4-alpha-N-acetylgalactosaminyltransferase